MVIPPYIWIILTWAKNTKSVSCVQKQLIFLKTRGVLGKQIIYLKSAKVGDSSGILFTFINIKIKKSKIFFFLYFFPILMIFKNSLIKIFCFWIPIYRYKFVKVWLKVKKWERFLYLVSPIYEQTLVIASVAKFFK